MLKFPRNPIKYNKKLILVTAVDTTNNITLDTMVFNSINDAEQYILDAKDAYYNDAYYNKDINIAFVIDVKLISTNHIDLIDRMKK